MKIVSGKLTFMNIPLRQAEYWAWGKRDIYTVGLVEFATDTGLVGIGEVNISMGPNEKVIAAIFDQMLDFYVGQSPFDSNIVMARIKGTGWYSYHRTAGLVLGGLDMACWDLAGKACGVPVAALLGGSLRTSFPSMYFVPGSEDIAGMIDAAASAVARGFGTIYYKVGADEERDVALVHKSRERLGGEPRIRVDANESWTPGTAVRVLKRMAPANIEYVEQPTLMYDIEGLKHVRQASGVPVGANQASWGSYAIMEIVRRGAADVIMTDMHQEGGVMALKRVLGICEAAGLPFVLHAFSATSFFIKAQLQVLSTSPMAFLGQQGHADYFSDEYMTNPLSYADGTIGFEPLPGWGVEPDPAKVEAFHKKFLKEGVASAYTNSRGGAVVNVPAR